MHTGNQQQNEENPLRRLIKDQSKKQLRKQSAKAVRALAKKIGKKAIAVAAKAALAAIKSLLVFLAGVLSPYLLIILAVILAILIIFLGVTLVLSNGDGLEGPAKELQEYIIQKSKETVDQSAPEQLPYQVPYQMIIAAIQLYDSEQELSYSTKKAVDLLASSLRPEFEYEIRQGKTETDYESCTTGKDGVKKCETYTKVEKFEVKLLVGVQAWNGTFSADVKAVTYGEGTPSRTYTYETHNEKFEENYYYFESVLISPPFDYKERDLELIDALYSATGGIINYTLWKSGESLINSGYGMNLNVTPGGNVPAEYMQYYLGAQQKFGVDWYYLAAIHFVETKFSTHPTMTSSVGAEGHTQFMPCTWHGWSYPGCQGGNGYTDIPASDKYNPKVIRKYNGYGLDADRNGKATPWDIADAIYTTAYYLSENGFRKNVDKAIWHYNHSAEYINEVKVKAKEFQEAATYAEADGQPPSVVKDGFTVPAKGRLTSGYGNRDLGFGIEFHAGIDIANSFNTPIYAAAQGTIKKTSGNCPSVGNLQSNCGGGWGNYIMINHTAGGQAFEAVYAHLAKILVSPGQSVSPGTLIGYMGSSGRSSGSHLHYEMHKGVRYRDNSNSVNPELYLPLQ